MTDLDPLTRYNYHKDDIKPIKEEKPKFIKIVKQKIKPIKKTIIKYKFMKGKSPFDTNMGDDEDFLGLKGFFK